MGPGPSDVPERILAALARPTIGHLDPKFVTLMGEIKELLQYALQTTNELTMPVSAPGSAGMEACFANLVEPGDKVVVCINGVFGGRMKENVIRCGGTAVVVEDAWGEPVSREKVAAALAENPDTKIVAFVHAETSTGAQSDAESLTRLAHEHGALVIVDAVTSLGGTPLKVDEWEIDAVYSGSQKCLSCVPGLSPVSFGERAVAKIEARSTPITSWFLDMTLVMGYWGGGTRRAYHHTAPVNSLYALHEALLILHEEELENAWQRHRDNHELLREGLEALNLEFFVAAADRLPQLNAVTVPEEIDEAFVRRHLLEQFNLEIGAGLGPMAGKIWRIGLMGHASNRNNIDYCLEALKDAFSQDGARA